MSIKSPKRSERIKELQDGLRETGRKIEEVDRLNHSLRRDENALAALTPCGWIVAFSISGLMGVSFYGKPEVYPASLLVETKIDSWLSVKVWNPKTCALQLTLRVNEHGKEVFFFCPRAGAVDPSCRVSTPRAGGLRRVLRQGLPAQSERASLDRAAEKRARETPRRLRRR